MKISKSNQEILIDFFSGNKIMNWFHLRIKEKFPNIFKEIEEFIIQFYFENKVMRYRELVYCYMYNIQKQPICENCLKKNVKFKQFSYGYAKFCSTKCSANSKEKKEKIENTNLEKYGHRNIAHGIYKETIKKNNLEKYGFEYSSQSPMFKEKIEKINLERYGNKSFRNSEQFKVRCKQIFLEKFGVDHQFKNPEIIAKAIQTRRKNGYCREDHIRESYKVYCREAQYYANKNFREYYYEINPEKFKRGTFEYHLDHIFPVYEGFRNNIHPELISHKNNLQMLFSEENRKKGPRTKMGLEDFYKQVGFN